MFTPVPDDPWIGTARIYMPQGYSPIQPASDRQLAQEHVLLAPGDAVTIQSAWTRPYLPDGGEILYYVKSHRTGKNTHVPESHLPLRVDFDKHPTWREFALEIQSWIEGTL